VKPPSTAYRGERLSGPDGERYGVRVLVDGKPLWPKRSLKIRSHSPHGFEWGYGGSGPAQLALAILLDVTDDVTTAREFYQRYKWAAVSQWGDRWETTAAEVLLWLRRFEAEEREAEWYDLLTTPRCRVCGCTQDDCRQCIAATGQPCHWVEPDLCSRCAPNAERLSPAKKGGDR
jgi:hypothetical protein